MLLDLFTYFAKFPASAGVTRGIATKGESSMEEYATVLSMLGNMQEKEKELVPEIENYVYGQSFDELKQRIDKLTGSFLFVDYGEVDMQSDGRRSFECTQRIAVTVAMKLPNTSDMLERIIANDRTLQMLSKIHARIMADAERGGTLLDGPRQRGQLRDHSFCLCRAAELWVDADALSHRSGYPGHPPHEPEDDERIVLCQLQEKAYLCNVLQQKDLRYETVKT